MKQSNDLKSIKKFNKQFLIKIWKKIKPHFLTFTIWFLVSLPINFVITIGLYYQLIGEASYMMIAKILTLIVINTLMSALIYFLIALIKHKFNKNNKT